MKETKSVREQIGEYMIDISKLTFAGVVLSTVLEVTTNKGVILLSGVIATLNLAVIGMILLNIKSKKQ